MSASWSCEYYAVNKWKSLIIAPETLRPLYTICDKLLAIKNASVCSSASVQIFSLTKIISL